MKSEVAAATYRRTTCAFISDLVEAKIVDVLQVNWPSGIVDTWRKLPTNQFLKLREGGEMKCC